MFDILVDISTKFSKCPNKNVLRCHDEFLVKNYNKTHIKHMIRQIRLENSLIVYRADQFDYHKTDKFFTLKEIKHFIFPRER